MVTIEEIKAILADTLSIAKDKLEDTMLLEGGDIESLRYVEMLLAIESQYGVQTSDEELKDIKSIGDLTKLIFNKIETTQEGKAY